MAIKLTLTDISSGYQGSDIQANFTAIEDEFDKVLYRDGSLTVTDTIDMNSQRLVNLPAPTSSTEPLRKDDQFTSAEAQAFATDAETAQTAAEAALETFQSQYVGESATDPTTDGNGDALTEGALYFDTTNNLLKAYDGASWINPALLYFPNVDANVTATEDELNLLDGATVTTAEINILDGVTATTAELNLLDGVTATTAEINVIDNSKETSIDLGGDFSSGIWYLRKVGKNVTLTSTASSDSHTSSSNPTSTLNIMPSEYRPFADVHAVTAITANGIEMIKVNENGTIEGFHRNWSGTLTAQTSMLGFTITYSRIS